MPLPTILPPGTLLGSYEIVDHVSTGGMGVIYRAHDTRLHRSVAIKVLRELEPDDEARRMLLHEARSASVLGHQNICTIFEVCEHCPQPFIAMEYVEGKTLLDVIPPDGLLLETAIRYAMDIASGLAHAHERGVVHRDLKCGNVVITPEGHVKVLDFGLASRRSVAALDDETGSWGKASDTPMLGGTFAYMAPEVLRAEIGDERSDIWALGVVLYEMVAGHLPFHAPTRAELVTAILRDPPEPLPARVPASLRGIVARCLAKEPGRRYQRASETRAALEAVQPDAVVEPPRPRVRARPRSRPARIRSMAVLPLANLSRDPDQEYLADGMTEALVLGLAKIGALRVTSRTSAMRYKNTSKTMPEIAAELGVDAVLEGSVQRAGSQVRITAQLIDGRTDAHLWSESYDRDLSDILGLQREVAEAIAKEIKVKVTRSERARLASVPKVDPLAHEAYLRGRHQWNRRTAQSLHRAVEYFEQAIERDPGHAQAHAGLASCYVPLAFFGYMAPKQAAMRARSAAQAALAIDDHLAEAHVVLAAVHHDLWSWKEAEAEYRRAIDLDAGYATAHQWFAEHLLDRGRFDEAFAEADRARERDPLSRAVNSLLGFASYTARRYDDAIAQLQKALELDPHFPTALWTLGLAQTMSGRRDEGLDTLRRAMEAAGGSRRIQASYGWACGLAGDMDGARRALTDLTAAAAEDVDFAYSAALVTLGMGDIDETIAWLQKGLEGRSIYFRHLATEPRWQVIADDPRYQEFVRQTGIRPS